MEVPRWQESGELFRTGLYRFGAPAVMDDRRVKFDYYFCYVNRKAIQPTADGGELN